jgi:hypothetical protein
VPNAAPCDDGVFCNGADTCQGGTCAVHAGDPCAAGAECARTCDEAAAACRDPAGTTCATDGNPCTTDACDGLGACVHPAGNAGTACRPSAGACDVAESCTGSSSTCPADAFASSATVCRTAAGACDPAERCTGAGPACPADAWAAGGTPCRAAAGACDPIELCTGTGPTCPADGLAAAGTVCRAAAGACDVAETCSGSSAVCPADALAPATTICRAATDVCDLAETCTDSSAACPADTGLPDGDGDGVCDARDTCPAVPNPVPADDDGDGLDDACDPCVGPTAVTRARLVLKNVDATPGDDGLVFKGSLALPLPVTPALDPAARGMRLQLRDAVGTTAFDLTIPPDGYDAAARTGWRTARSGAAWTWKSALGSGGVRKIAVRADPSRPGVVAVKVAGRYGTYGPGALPPTVTVIFDPAGQCGDAVFTPPAGCVPAGRRLTCR